MNWSTYTTPSTIQSAECEAFGRAVLVEIRRNHTIHAMVFSATNDYIYDEIVISWGTLTTAKKLANELATKAVAWCKKH